jgi:hypothetical protein
LKQSLEQEKMKELQSKPKILKKSRVLAEIHDKKFFENSSPCKTLTNTPDDKDLKSENDKKDMPCIITVRSVPYSSPDPSQLKVQRPKSAQPHSIIERSKAWLKAKKEKIGQNRMIHEKNALAECTFSPGMLKKSLKRGEKGFKDEANTPQSIETHADSTDHPKKKQKTNPGRSLTPYQQKISFKSGLDIENFLKRAR